MSFRKTEIWKPLPKTAIQLSESLFDRLQHTEQQITATALATINHSLLLEDDDLLDYVGLHLMSPAAEIRLVKRIHLMTIC